jgi:hypothetical protein
MALHKKNSDDLPNRPQSPVSAGIVVVTPLDVERVKRLRKWMRPEMPVS